MSRRGGVRNFWGPWVPSVLFLAESTLQTSVSYSEKWAVPGKAPLQRSQWVLQVIPLPRSLNSLVMEHTFHLNGTDSTVERDNGLEWVCLRYKQLILLFPKRKCKMPRIQGIQEPRDLWDSCPSTPPPSSVFYKISVIQEALGKQGTRGNQLGDTVEAIPVRIRKHGRAGRLSCRESLTHRSLFCPSTKRKEKSQRARMSERRRWGERFVELLCSLLSRASCHWAPSLPKSD